MAQETPMSLGPFFLPHHCPLPHCHRHRLCCCRLSPSPSLSPAIVILSCCSLFLPREQLLTVVVGGAVVVVVSGGGGGSLFMFSPSCVCHFIIVPRIPISCSLCHSPSHCKSFVVCGHCRPFFPSSLSPFLSLSFPIRLSLVVGC
jgi:hypothetical protein